MKGSSNSKVGLGGVGSALGKAQCSKSKGAKWKAKTKSKGMCE